MKRKRSSGTLKTKSKALEITDEGAVNEEENDFSKGLLSTTVLKKKKSGGFQSMGLSKPMLETILRRYKVPTPIQRTAIPVVMEGKDVVAMARTGSGKTGAFLIPMFERLKAPTSTVGARALIFSPTRELALQTLKFTKELGRHTKLKAILVLGGEKMEDQFAAVHDNPDIIVATPGRFLHLVIEMDLKLNSVEYVVFDEADRLFEMGFQEQIEEVLHRLPEHRQTVMFSATLPSVLVDFAKAGLSDPELIRLDVEHKLSENLKTKYLCCCPTDKPAILLHLLKNVINMSEELTVVFLATRHHVEYIKDILIKASIPCSYIYSSLDQVARKIHVAQFRARKVGVLLVTDIAARGIDIPLLDNVINYNFPSKPKLFVHRVGRVARAGRSGTAYSLVSPDEASYLLDLHLFLGKPLTLSDGSTENDGVCGSVPQSIIDDENDTLCAYHETSVDLRNMVKVCDNAYKQYIKSRPAPSSESVKRAKSCTLFTSNKVHPMFCVKGSMEAERSNFLSSMKNYRPNTTIFEIGSTAKSIASSVMREKRMYHSVVDKIRSMKSSSLEADAVNNECVGKTMSSATESEIQDAFPSVCIKESKNCPEKSKKKKNQDFKDHENYLQYMSQQHYTEKGLGLQSSFQQDVSQSVLDLTADDADGAKKLKNAWHWDRKKKRFTKEEGGGQKKVKTESGVWIPKSYKTDLYKKWKNQHKISHQENHSGDENEGETETKKFAKSWKGRKGRNNKQDNKPGRPFKREFKTKEEILKERKRKGRLQAHQKLRQMKRGKKRGHVGKHRK